MNGMVQLWELRRKGFKPCCVNIYDDSSPILVSHAQEWHFHPNRFDGGALYARIQLDESDLPERIDFRPLTGLEVFVNGLRNEDRTRRIYEAVKRINPVLIAAALSDAVMIFRKETGDEFHSYA